jgi:polyisoprenoid-binding protein YceI
MRKRAQNERYLLHMIRLFTAIFVLTSAAHAAEIDPKASSFTWTASKITGSTHTGQLAPVSSALTLKGDELVGGEIVLDLKNFTVTDLQGKIAQKFLRHIKSDDFFNVEQFPTSRLEVQSIDKGVATGRLQIMNTAKPVTFPIKKEGNSYVGTLTFDRTEFNIKYGSGKFFKGLGDRVISDEVSVKFSFTLKPNAIPSPPK